METSAEDNLTQAQYELYGWIKEYMKNFQHSPSIRQMMEAMGLKSPAPIQSRLKHLQEKGFISWQEGKARTLQLVDKVLEGIQPTFKQVPPKVSYFSIKAVFIPSCAQRMAATYPPGPEPITATSYFSMTAL